MFGTPNEGPYVKDGINDFVVGGRVDAVNRDGAGTKVAAHHLLELGPGGSARSACACPRRAPAPVPKSKPLGPTFDRTFAARRKEADKFYATLIPPTLEPDAAMVMRQSLAGLLWSKQYYEYDVHRWLREHGCDPWDQRAAQLRAQPALVSHDRAGHHLDARQVGVPVVRRLGPGVPRGAAVARRRRLRQGAGGAPAEDRYLHPNGQIPAYEWNFSDVNPPVTPWAALFVYEREAEIRGEGDRQFLARVFDRLLTNFTWWVNRKDPDDRNLFQGGFLGLDNIGIFDRSAPLPGGGRLEQADGTAWMALYCQWMLQIAAELAKTDPTYADMALKFIAHFEWIAIAMNPPAGDAELWDEEDGFYYDVMRMPDGTAIKLKVRSLVGLLPLCAATVFDGDVIARHPALIDTVTQFVGEFSDSIPSLLNVPGPNPDGARILSLVDEPRLRRMLDVMLDEDEFLGPHGIRAISRRHLDQPEVFEWDGQRYEVHYLPAESDTGMFGGNSNWRGPVWFPMNLVILRGLIQLHRYYGDRVTVECPTGSGNKMNLLEVVTEIGRRLATTFTEDEDGRRPVFGGIEQFQDDPHWHDLLLFHEYFHGDNGAGIGASHQTGWTGTVALLFLLAGGRWRSRKL